MADIKPHNYRPDIDGMRAMEIALMSSMGILSIVIQHICQTRAQNIFLT